MCITAEKGQACFLRTLGVAVRRWICKSEQHWVKQKGTLVFAVGWLFLHRGERDVVSTLSAYLQYLEGA